MQNQPSTYTGTGHITQTDRLYYLDWLRVFAILLVFLVHCSKIFDYHTTVVFNTVRSPVLSAFRDFSLLWIMPLFFVLSGAAVFLSKGSDKTGEFIKSRFLRLLVPLIFIGTFIINPLYVYIERLSSGEAASGFFQWYPQFFDGIYGFGGNFAPLGQGTHLWYLEFLFIYSLILLPLFVRSKKRGTSFLSRLSIHFEKPWALFFLFLPISAVAAAFEIIGLGGLRVMGGWDPISYLLFLSYGYLIFSNAKIGETIKKYSPIYLAVAIILTALLLDSHFGFILNIPGLTRYDLLNDGALLPQNQSLWIAVQALRGLLGWCWIIGLLGLGRRFLNFNNKFLVYANEAVLPFYILHHTVIYIIGYYVIQWSGNIGSKFLIISITSFTIIMAIYEILIRRFNLLRFLFGMKTKKYSRIWQTVLYVISGLSFVLVMALLIVSLKVENMSPPPTKPGLYVNEEFGFQLTFPTSMNEQGELTSDDMLFHIKHPKKTMFLKIRKNVIPANQPLDPQAGKKWIKRVMRNLGMKNPEILSTEIFTTPDGTKALYAAIKFKTRTLSLVGTYTFVNKNGKRLFIAGYNDDGFEPLEQIMKSLTFK
jgi:peptidoglycan/LPS O-acetylase OafA/YrhL